MVSCKLLNIEIDISRTCPASKNFRKSFLCYKDCGFSPLRDKNKKRIVQAKLYEDTEKCDVVWSFKKIKKYI